NSLMANSFKKKRKFSAYGIASSTGKTGLNWDEKGKFGDGGNTDMQMNDDGGMYMSWGGGDNFDNSNYWGEGIPKSWSGGVNYTDKFNNDKQSLNGSYRYSKIINNGGGKTISQSILPDTLFFNNEKRNVYGNKDRHAINSSYDWMVDSFFSAKFTVAGTKGTINGTSNYYSEALNANNQFVNKSKRSNTSNGDNQSFKSSLLLRKRFKKIGRTVSLSIDQSWNENKTNGLLYSVNDYFNKLGINNRSDTTDQKKINGSNNKSINSRLSYTEQLAKNTTLEVTYGINLNQYENKVLSYDKSQPEKYDLLNTKYSNDYDFKIFTNRVGSTIRFNPKKLNVSLGGDIAFANFSQKDLIKDSTSKYTYTNLFPRANFTYKFNANKRLNINYNGSTRQPSIQQIQPVSDNTNPLYVQVGNAFLKQEFNHRFGLSFNNYQVLKNRGYYANINYGFTEKAIRSNQTTDSVGKTISQYINANGNYNYRSSISYNAKLQKIDASIYVQYSYNHNNDIGFVNGLKNITKNNSHSLYININKEKEKVYNLQLGSNLSYNMSNSSIRPDIKTNYWSANFNVELNIQLPWKLELNNEIEMEIRQKTSFFTGNNNVTVWNGFLAKKFLKNDKGQLRLSAFDILNQNRGYSRNINSTTITENTYQQLAQYFMLSFVWNFSKGGTALK
ncbi:MAG: outer membrane beta-barrel protein, partial [Chitinophagaceae bacterium]|nr:outer membrane beta-barrel protein [Chitinophagaceae bacterium]